MNLNLAVFCFQPLPCPILVDIIILILKKKMRFKYCKPEGREEVVDYHSAREERSSIILYPSTYKLLPKRKVL